VIVYFDTSALVATYVDDACSAAAITARADARAIATSLVAFAETLAAFASLTRARALTPGQRRKAESAFLADWPSFHRLRVDGRLLPEIRRILGHHPLKGADSIHLASALLVSRRAVAAGLETRLACDDRALAAAATAEGLLLAW
jgi:uncharacterized protein